MTTPRTGLIFDLPSDEYHTDPGSVSNGMLSSMNKSPAHCYALHLAPNRPFLPPTDAMRRGTMTHTYVLEPDSFSDRYIVLPEGIDYRTKDGKAWRDAQTAEIVTAEDVATAAAQRDAVMKVTALRNLLADGVAESSAFWADKATGLRCRARPDWLQCRGRLATALDLKTISDITPEAVQRAIATYGYHRQAAHYKAGVEACGYKVEEFVFGFVSSSYPFIAAAYVLDDETMQQGQDEVAELLDRFKFCRDRNEWPAYGDGYLATGLPTWAKRSSEVEVSYV